MKALRITKSMIKNDRMAGLPAGFLTRRDSSFRD